ncbi:MAG: hypothetical protein LBB81_03080 [Treponema sp.]|nr:hypothetical protein [Treponema sp.]
MKKKSLLALVLAVFAAGTVFAETDFKAMAKNTVTLDAGPAIIGAGFGAAGRVLDIEGFGSSGFGFGVQYERQLFKKLSVAGRFAYMGVNLGVTLEAEDRIGTLTAKPELNLFSYSLEGHVRFYPFGEAFFLDGMLGYANMSTKISGELIVSNDEYDVNKKEAVSFDISNGYYKLGAKLGWRIGFGKNGGFTFEPAVGYYGGINRGATFADKLFDEAGGDIVGLTDNIENTKFAINAIPNFIFVGGPRLTLAFGYRF